jgi:hypothetical protein
MRRACLLLATLAAALLALPPQVRAAADEIVVFDDEIAAPGEFDFEFHVNYVPSGRKEPAYEGEQPPYRILRYMPEIVYGIAPRWEVGFHLPMSTSMVTHSTFVDGARVRVKTIRDAQQAWGTLFWGVNAELAYYDYRVSPARWVAELRGILGARIEDWTFIVNPVLAIPLSDSREGSQTPDLDLAAKASRRVTDRLALGVEHYAELGQTTNLTVDRLSSQITFAVLDYDGRDWSLNFGIGAGWTDPADNVVIKAVIGFPF